MNHKKITRAVKNFAKISCLSLTLSCLSGCIPAAIVIGATAGGAIIYDKRTMKTMMQDRESAHAATTLIAMSPALKDNTHIVVAVFNHILLLVGQTKTNEQRTIAYKLVQEVKYVTRIYNEITVQKPTSLWRRSEDTWLTTRVKTEMLTKSGLHSTQIKVVSENGVVYLMGVVSHHQADLAASVARRVKGVKKVVKVFQYPQ